MSTVLRYRPMNLGRWVIWGATALLFGVLPLFFSQGFALTLMSQMGTMVIFALSYNMLLGQSGMLSFGHAVYSGLGAFCAIHALNLIGAGRLHLPVSLLPLVGGLGGAAFGIVFGYVTTRKSGTPFAMITLGIAEMVAAASLMLPRFFGGEGGITANRVVGEPVLGISYGPAIQVYYLIAAWCLLCMVAMFAFTQTPLGRIANAVRDNPERAQFIGYDPRAVRFLVLVLSGFFAGIAGGLSAINFEIVSAENVSAVRSGGVLLATFIGGASFFFGPILGAVIFIFFAVALSDFTKAWQLYLGLFFVLMVMYAPGGVASLVLMNLRVAKYKRFKALRDPYVGLLMAAATLGLGLILFVELAYHLTLESSQGSSLKLFGFAVDAAGSAAWLWAAGFTLAGAGMFGYARRRFRAAWDRVQELIEEDIARSPL